MDSTRAAAQARVAKFIPVEPGVSGKEKLFQQNRNFGPGPTSPHPPGSKVEHPKALYPRNGGTYSSGAKARPIPGGTGKPRTGALKEQAA
jgi:hypothetical protein